MFRQLLIAVLVGLALSAPTSKVSSSLANILAKGGKPKAVISFNGDTDAVLTNVNAMRFASRGAKITDMKRQLEALAEENQKNAIAILGEQSFHSLWINNRIYVEGLTQEVAAQLNQLAEVTEIREEFVAYIDEPIFSEATINAEWGIKKIEAEAAWALPGGNNGAGVVVGSIDTGVRATHEALRNNHRAQNGWFDPYTNTSTPTDDKGHGTHTMGTIVGSGGIGVAPGAQWISCRGCGPASCTEAALSRCGQFMACPTNAQGQQPNCNLAPVLVSNSWGGGQGQTWYDTVINSWITAGIIPLFSIGNSGSSCGTVYSPGDSPNVIGVGSTRDIDGASTFSSRGPAANGTIKPDISAPGSDIRSAWSSSDTAYSTISGTSMACPHVAGVTALLFSRNPNFTYDQIKELIYNNATRNLLGTDDCGGVPGYYFPNNVYGHGRVNARNSLQAAIYGF